MSDVHVRSANNGDVGSVGHRFYENYHGHHIHHLETLTSQFRRLKQNIVFLAGDSSLDNKYWVLEEPRVPTHAGYQCVMTKRHLLEIKEQNEAVPDIAYWLHGKCQYHRMACVNAAVEEATLSSKMQEMNAQDTFVMNNLQANDILVVSIGGNDVALKPTMGTIMAMAGLMLQPMVLLGYYNPAMMYLRHLFKTTLETYIKKLTHKQSPKLVIVCFLYYPDENSAVDSWANRTLSALGYNQNPKVLQDRMKLVFETCVKQIQLPSCASVKFLPLFEVLDGKRTEEYAKRVEPSGLGGQKIADKLFEMIQQ